MIALGIFFGVLALVLILVLALPTGDLPIDRDDGPILTDEQYDERDKGTP